MFFFVLKESPLVNLEHPKYQENLILPYLLHSTPKSDLMKLVGEEGDFVTINTVYAYALLQMEKDRAFDCLIVPDAPMDVMVALCKLLHTGR